MTGFTWDRECEGYFARHRLSNGQFCMIGFYKFETSRAIAYYVAFAVADKKKALNGWFDGSSDDSITEPGSGGLAMLFPWTSPCILIMMATPLHSPTLFVTQGMIIVFLITTFLSFVGSSPNEISRYSK